MQPLQVNLSTAVTDSCSDCSCCFPRKKNKKKQKEQDAVREIGENYFMKKKIDDEYEAKKIHVSEASKSVTGSF